VTLLPIIKGFDHPLAVGGESADDLELDAFGFDNLCYPRPDGVADLPPLERERVIGADIPVTERLYRVEMFRIVRVPWEIKQERKHLLGGQVDVGPYLKFFHIDRYSRGESKRSAPEGVFGAAGTWAVRGFILASPRYRGMLSGVNIALGVTGSIAAVKTVELAHELRRRGASVRGVTTGGATGIVHPWAIEFATENDVITEITGAVEHVELCGAEGWADVFLIAPATANTVGKIAAAIDDTPVTTCATTALGAGVPVVIAPAMHEPMYDHPGVLEAIERVESWGVPFVEPRIEEGKAKIATIDAIALETARAVGRSSLANEHVVVTAGGTAEPIDPVRVLTNRASGKTGRAVARACYVRGADVTLIHGRGDLDRGLPWADLRHVGTAAEMQEAVEAAVADADALVSAAAIGDYTVDAAPEKLRSGRKDLTLSLRPAPKLIDGVRDRHPDLPIVGFKTETGGDDEEMITQSRRLMERVGLSFVVANDASVMGEDRSRALIVRENTESVFEGTKVDLGARVADEMANTT
jgi:phosphopantothenoylcysteine decarboxylase/phosphopantothenate--cysteine ligase